MIDGVALFIQNQELKRLLGRVVDAYSARATGKVDGPDFEQRIGEIVTDVVRQSDDDGQEPCQEQRP